MWERREFRNLDQDCQLGSRNLKVALRRLRRLRRFAREGNANELGLETTMVDIVRRDNRRRFAERPSTKDLLRTHGPDDRLVVVGDAATNPYEIVQPE